MTRLTAEAKKVIVKQALNSKGMSQADNDVAAALMRNSFDAVVAEMNLQIAGVPLIKAGLIEKV